MKRPANLASDTSARTLLSHPRVEQFSTSRLELFIARDFLPREACAALIELIDRERSASIVTDSNGDPYFRTSETCDLASASSPLITAIDAVLSAFSGIDPAYGEPLQGQRYDVGQEFKPHTDYFEPTGANFARLCSIIGNRTWTFMIYLNDVEAGGETRFEAIEETVWPATGTMLAWNNRRADGSPNPDTVHQGTKVRAGVKYIVTKWYREKPSEFTQ